MITGLSILTDHNTAEFDAVVDTLLKILLKKDFKSIIVKHCNIDIYTNGFVSTLWFANYPYAIFQNGIIGGYHYDGKRGSKITMFLLYRKIQKFILSNLEDISFVNANVFQIKKGAESCG